MCIKNRAFSLIYKILLLALCGYGLYSYSGLPEGALNLSAFMYFTILSNLLVFLFMFASAVYVVRRIAKSGVRGYATYAPAMKGAVLMAITVTMLIYWIILAPSAFAMAGDGGHSLRNSIVHLYVPLGVLLDWLLFDRKGRWGALAPFAWEIIPLLYWGYTLLAAQLGAVYQGGARYPYGFINIDTYGWPVVLRNVGLLCLAFLALGYLLWGLDKLLAGFDRRAREGRTVYNRGQGLSVPSGVTPRPEMPTEGAGLSASIEAGDPEKEQLVQRALAAEPVLGDEPAALAGEPGVAALAQPPHQGDASPQVSATAMRAGDTPCGQAVEVTTARPGDDRLR